MNREQISRLRQQLCQSEAARQIQLDVLLGLGPVIQGSVGRVVRRCGKPTCHCAHGPQHACQRFTRSVGGRTQGHTVPVRDVPTVARKAHEYHRWRCARAALMKLAAQTAALADALQAALTEPYPAPRPAPGEPVAEGAAPAP